MSQQVYIENDPILKKVIKILSTDNYLKTKFPNIKRGQIIGCTQENINLQWVLDYYNKIGIDWKELQRNFQPWTDEEKDEFITNVLSGYELKDTFQVIILSEQIKWIEEQLETNIAESKKDKLKRDLVYFKYWRDEKKMTYLCIDGQHRLYYLYQLLTNKITINITKPESSEWIVDGDRVDINELFINQLPDSVQDFIKEIQLACIFWAKAPLRKFAFIFTSCNKGKSPHQHEMRSVFNRSDWGLFSSGVLLECPDRDRIWKDTIKLSKKITFEQKADTYYLASLFPFWYSESGYKALPMVAKYDFTSTDFLYDLDYNIPNKFLNEYYTDIKQLYIMIKELNPKNFTVCQFTNLLYYYIRYTKVGVGPDEKIYNIRRHLDFINQFLDDEQSRIENDRWQVGQDGQFLLDQDGYKIQKEHRYESKNSTNTFGNVKYRKQFMDDNIFKNVTKLENEGIIQKQGNRDTGLTAEKVAFNNNYKDRSNKEIDRVALRSKDSKDSYVINEELPTSQGGDRTLDNTNLMKQKDNVHLYHTEQKIKEGR